MTERVCNLSELPISKVWWVFTLVEKVPPKNGLVERPQVRGQTSTHVFGRTNLSLKLDWSTLFGFEADNTLCILLDRVDTGRRLGDAEQSGIEIVFVAFFAVGYH